MPSSSLTIVADVPHSEEEDMEASSQKITIDAISTVDEYLDRSDWRVNANANQDYSLGGLILNTSGKTIANYWLSEVYSQ